MTATNNAPTQLGLGKTQVTFKAKDLDGNGGTATSTLTVKQERGPISHTIGPKGHTIAGVQGTTIAGFKLEIPAGALRSPVGFTIKQRPLGRQLEKEIKPFLTQSILGPRQLRLNPELVSPMISIDAKQGDLSKQTILTKPGILTMPFIRGLALKGANDLVVASLSKNREIKYLTGDPRGEHDETMITQPANLSVPIYEFGQMFVVSIGDGKVSQTRKKVSAIKTVGCDLSSLPPETSGRAFHQPLNGTILDDQAILKPCDRSEECKRKSLTTRDPNSIDRIILHSTMTPHHKPDLDASILNGYFKRENSTGKEKVNLTRQAHYYIDRAVEQVVVRPAAEAIYALDHDADQDSYEMSIYQGQQLQLVAEPRAKVTRLVDEGFVANHGAWKDQDSKRSIGITLFQSARRTNWDTAKATSSITPAQYGALRELIRGLKQRIPILEESVNPSFPIAGVNVLLHSESKRSNYNKECKRGLWWPCGSLDPWEVNTEMAREFVGTCKIPGRPIALPSEQVMWQSKDPNVATVQNGLVTAQSSGKTTITVSASGVSDSLRIKVLNKISDNNYHPPAISIRLNEACALPHSWVPGTCHGTKIDATWDASSEAGIRRVELWYFQDKNSSNNDKDPELVPTEFIKDLFSNITSTPLRSKKEDFTVPFPYHRGYPLCSGGSSNHTSNPQGLYLGTIVWDAIGQRAVAPSPDLITLWGCI
ncbi:MAG: hypothetical protein NPIRA04_33460 [Nitrospirales bacterium]|nr:MAG: hypothetical protein NPIRA04_33460 [Nitrospirales bacterium]